MVTNNYQFEEQVRRLLSQTKSELEMIEAQIAELEGKRAFLRAEVQAFEMTIRGYLRQTGRQETAEPEWIKLLGGQINKERLLTIAKHSGGKITVKQATNLLYNRFIKSKNRSVAYTMIQGLLSNLAQDGKLAKVAPGEYKLVEAQPNLPGVS